MDNMYMVAGLITLVVGLLAAYSSMIAKKRKAASKKRRAQEALGIFRTINVVISDNVAIITLDRPRKKNAFSKAMYKELETALRSASENSAVKVIMLIGNGDYYSSGNDLSNFSEIKHPLTIAKEARQVLFSFVDSFVTCTKPIVVAVNGPAIGIAVTMLGLCDKVFAAEKATFRTPFAALGQTPEGCSTFTFPKIMGEEIAKKVLGEGLVLSAQDALQCGLVNCVVPDENIKDVVTKYCYHIATLAPTDNELIKKIKKENLLEKLKDVNLAECEVLEVAVVSKECFTALATYLDSRNMKIAAFVMRFANMTGFLWGQPERKK